MAIIDPTKLMFSTRYNIQKTYLEGSIVVAVADIVDPTEYSLTTHGLGYIPTARVFYIPVSGQLWPLSPEQYPAVTGSGTQLPVYGSAVLTTNELKVRVTNGSGSAQNITFYYRIYLDS